MDNQNQDLEKFLKILQTRIIKWKPIYENAGLDKKYVFKEIECEVKSITEYSIVHKLSVEDGIKAMEKEGLIYGKQDILLEIPSITDGSFSHANCDGLWRSVAIYSTHAFHKEMLKPMTIMVKLSSLDAELCNSIEPEWAAVTGVHDAADKQFASDNYYVKSVAFRTLASPDPDLKINYCYKTLKPQSK
jgi:hypothetical protein